MTQETGTVDMDGWREKRTVVVSYSQPFSERPSVTLLPHRANVAVTNWGTTGFAFQGVALGPGASVMWVATEMNYERTTNANTA